MNEEQLALVQAAFERLLDKVWKSGCDVNTGQVIFFAQADVLAILRGEWDDEYGPLDADVMAAQLAAREAGR